MAPRGEIVVMLEYPLAYPSTEPNPDARMVHHMFYITVAVIHPPHRLPCICRAPAGSMPEIGRQLVWPRCAGQCVIRALFPESIRRLIAGAMLTPVASRRNSAIAAFRRRRCSACSGGVPRKLPERPRREHTR